MHFKTLEEPPPGSLILLLSTVPEAILETVCPVAKLRCGLKRSKNQPGREAILSALKECLITKKDQERASIPVGTSCSGDSVGDSRKNRVRTRRPAPQGDARYKQASDNSWFEERRAS